MNPGSIRAVALLAASSLWLTTGLQPILARMQVAPQDEPDPTSESSPVPCPTEPQRSNTDGDEQEEKNACTGVGLGDLLDRHQRSPNPAHLGAAVADLPIQSPASPASRPAWLARRLGRLIAPHEWGQQAHWPCGPPARRANIVPGAV